MNEIEIHFSKSGNTVIGNYTAYVPLDKAMQAKSVFMPEGFKVRCALPDFARLVEYVQTFGHCIKTLTGFRKACELAGVSLERSVNAR